jgi:DNA-binding transcriptional LysR family regulator
MVPTALAKALIGPARQALRLLEDPLSTAQPFEPLGARLRFRLSMSDLTEARLLPRLVQTLRAEAPGVTLESFSVPRRDLVQALATGALDLAVDVPLLADPLVQHAALLEDRYVCVVRQDHPLGERRLTLQRFLEMDHLHLSSRPRGLGHVDLALERLGKRRRIMLRAQHFLVAPEVLMASDLVLTVPRSFADHMATRYPLRMVELPFPLPPWRAIFTGWRSGMRTPRFCGYAPSWPRKRCAWRPCARAEGPINNVHSPSCVEAKGNYG